MIKASRIISAFTAAALLLVPVSAKTESNNELESTMRFIHGAADITAHDTDKSGSITIADAALIKHGILYPQAQQPVTPPLTSISIRPVDNLSEDFICGADISSLIALEESGCRFYGFDGKEQDIFLTLAQSGINYIRVRVWNNPFDANGNGYGGGNCDAQKAAQLGSRAAKYGIKLLVDFHYSDFWCDPASQKAPKAWRGMNLSQKQDALYGFTRDSLNTIISAGAQVGMVQIGNETVSGMCGETSWDAIAALMNSGSRAVRDIDRNISVALHFTNPEKSGHYSYIAQQLAQRSVDYDIFATSYYPYWHGTTDNLTGVLNDISRTYSKKIIIAETSYPYTLDNGDMHSNVIGTDASGLSYPVSVQGQADAVRDVAAAVAAIGSAGLGVFYWEPAWLPVPASDWNGQSSLWEKYGAGWASSYSSEYDPDNAGKWYGGSAWDNQAMFDSTGHPLESLLVFAYIHPKK